MSDQPSPPREQPVKKSRNPLRRLYDWVLSWANHPFGSVVLCVLAFTESSFFPIPPDVLQIALSIERPKRSFFYAFISAMFSTVGALLGWFIGYALWVWLEPVFVPHIISQANIETVRHAFDTWGFWALFAAAFTPIPFKVFTITAGMMKMFIPTFLLASLIGRSMRFFIVAALLYFFGAKVKGFIDRWFGPLTVLLLVLILLGFYAVKYLL